MIQLTFDGETDGAVVGLFDGASVVGEPDGLVVGAAVDGEADGAFVLG